MPNECGDANAVCPFYKKNRGVNLICEAVPDHTLRHVIVFKTRARMLKYKETRCDRFDYAKKCPYAAMLQKKWNGDDF